MMIYVFTVFLDCRMHTPQIWEENGGASYRLNVAYLARCGGWGEGAAVECFGFFFSYFPPLKPRYIIWSGASYSLKNTVNFISDTLKH